MASILGVRELSHHPSKFGDHGHCGSRDMFLVCPVILTEHVIKWSCDFMCGAPHGKSPPCQVW